MGADLYDPARHEPLLGIAWDAARARSAIGAIVAGLEDAREPDGGWPWHPLDDAGPHEPRPQSLYLGAAGVLWALWYLRSAGAARLRIDPERLIGAVHGAYLAQPDTGNAVPSYFVGESGILLCQWRMAGSPAAAERLHAAVAANIGHPSNEALWGAPGTLVAALHMLERTQEARWRDLVRDNVEQLWGTWHVSGHAPCHLWTQDLYGHVVEHVGAGHGFAGNAYPLLRCARLLSPQRRESLYERCVETLRVTALRGEGLCNWPPSVGSARPGRTKVLVQWCHGAPGIVTSLAHFPAHRSSELEAMLTAAGEVVWRAGPLAKGPGLCHGTAGNGYAFLALHRRTGDPLWLERARAFAMHAIAQSERAYRDHGRWRCTLWTGDAGLAVYLWHCLEGTGGLPGLDVLD